MTKWLVLLPDVSVCEGVCSDLACCHDEGRRSILSVWTSTIQLAGEETWLEPKGRRINSLLLTEWNIFLLLLGDRTPKLPAFGLGICISRYLGSQAFSWPQTKRSVLCVSECLVFRVRPCYVTALPIKKPLFLPACLSPDYLLFLIKFPFNCL